MKSGIERECEITATLLPFAAGFVIDHFLKDALQKAVFFFRGAGEGLDFQNVRELRDKRLPEIEQAAQFPLLCLQREDTR